MASHSDPSHSGDLHSFSNPLDEVLNARMRRLANNYYGSLFKYQWRQEEIQQRRRRGESLSELDQSILTVPYPTLAQYLAYLSRLDADHQTDDRGSGN